MIRRVLILRIIHDDVRLKECRYLVRATECGHEYEMLHKSLMTKRSETGLCRDCVVARTFRRPAAPAEKREPVDDAILWAHKLWNKALSSE